MKDTNYRDLEIFGIGEELHTYEMIQLKSLLVWSFISIMDLR